MSSSKEKGNGGEPVRGMTPPRSFLQRIMALLRLSGGQQPTDREKPVGQYAARGIDPHKTQTILREGISAILNRIAGLPSERKSDTLVFPTDDEHLTLGDLEKFVRKKGGELVFIASNDVPNAYAIWVIGKSNNCFVAYYVVSNTGVCRTGKEMRKTKVYYFDTLIIEELPPSSMGDDDISEIVEEKYLLLAREKGLKHEVLD